MSFYRELKRRKVFRVAAVYAVVAWLLVQIVVTVEAPLGLPGWVDTLVIVLLVIGFPVTLILSWAFDVTPEGIRAAGAPSVSRAREPAVHWLTHVSQALVLLAVGFLVADQYFFDRGTRAGGVEVGNGPTEAREGPVVRMAAPVGGATVRGPYISRDGYRVAFHVGRSASRPAQIYVREIDEFDEQPIAGTEAADTENRAALSAVCFSPDGAWIAFESGVIGDGEIKKIALGGGEPLPVAEGFTGAISCDWTEGDEIYFTTREGMMRVPASGGPAEVVVASNYSNYRAYLRPQLLPGGTWLMFTAAREPSFSMDVIVFNLETREQTIVLRDAGIATYVPTAPGSRQGYLVYGQNGTLHAAPFDVDRLAASSPSVVFTGVLSDGVLTLVDVSETGTLAYFGSPSEGPHRAVVLTWFDRDGNERVLSGAPRSFEDPRLSPDGRRVAVSIRNTDYRSNDIWLYDLNAERLTRRLTFGGLNLYPVWAPNGEGLIYLHAPDVSGRNAELRYVRDDNSGDPVTLASWPDSFELPQPTSISTDGSVLIATRTSVDDLLNDDVLAVPLPTQPFADVRSREAEVRPLLSTRFNEHHAVLSPDGAYLAYTSDLSGRDEVYVAPYPDPGSVELVSTDGGRMPRWNPNGGELFYLGENQMMVVKVETSPVLGLSSPESLFELPILADFDGAPYDVSHDGSGFVMVIEPETPMGGPELRIVVNWLSELKSIVPLE